MSSYISPKMQDEFCALSVDMQKAILEKNVQIKNEKDLIFAVERVTAERAGG